MKRLFLTTAYLTILSSLVFAQLPTDSSTFNGWFTPTTTASKEPTPLVVYLNKIIDRTSISLYGVMYAPNYLYNLSLTEFAQLANRSLPTFKREFKRMFHTTPSQWLMQKRLTHAETLLKTTEKSISDIVQESGFESGPHFSRVFKTQFEIPPLLYRKQVNLQ